MDLEYNTGRNQLVFREYGRNIQKLIEYAITVKDDKERQQVVQYIIDLMGQTNPHLRNVEEFRHKLYDHLFIVSRFKLDVESPYPIPTEEQFAIKPAPIPYPVRKMNYRHYGQFVEKMIKKALEIEDDEKRQAFTHVVGNYMKLVYEQWNQDTVNDIIIRQDLETLSNGKLSIDDDVILKKSNLTKKPKARTTPSYRKPKGQNRNFSGGGFKKRKKS